MNLEYRTRSEGIGIMKSLMSRDVHDEDKMVEGPIRVFVLEEYSGLHALGAPLPLCIHMQELGLRMAHDALWSSRQSNSGFSVTFYWPWPLSNGVWLSSTPHLDNRWVRPKRRRRRRRRRPANNKSSPGAAPRPPSKREVSETRHCSTPKKPFDEDTLVNMNVSGSHGSEKEEECCDVGSEFEALGSALSSDHNIPAEASGSDESSVVDLASYPPEELEYDQGAEKLEYVSRRMVVLDGPLSRES